MTLNPENRTYPVRSVARVERLQQEYTAKIERNKQAGRKSFSNGEFTPFKGYERSRQPDIFGIILELDPQSSATLTKRVVEPLQEIAQTHQIPLIFTGEKDLPPHITLEAGTFKNMLPDDRKKIEDALFSERHFLPVTSILEGMQFDLDTLVIAPNSYTCASRFDALQQTAYKIRRILIKEMAKARRIALGLPSVDDPRTFAEPFPYQDIFHSSLARVVGTADPKNLTKFLEEAYETVGKPLEEDPIHASIGRVFRGTALLFMETHRPQLLYD